MIYNPAVAAIGVLLVIAMAALIITATRREPRNVQPTNCDRAWSQQQHRKDTEL